MQILSQQELPISERETTRNNDNRAESCGCALLQRLNKVFQHCRGNRGPCQVFGLMLGFAAPRQFCREHRAPCWFLGKMLRSAGSRFRSTGAPKMPGNSSNQGHYTPPAVVKCKFPLSELRGEATYYTHRAVAGSRFPSTMPHLKESFEYRFYSRSM